MYSDNYPQILDQLLLLIYLLSHLNESKNKMNQKNTMIMTKMINQSNKTKEKEEKYTKNVYDCSFDVVVVVHSFACIYRATLQ